MSDAGEGTAPSIELADVRTTADAVAWLHTRADTYAYAEAKAQSPIDAKALRLASATTGALADLLATVDAKTASSVLTSMARDYAQTGEDNAARHDPAYWRACRHLADTCGAIGRQLTTATRPRRGPHSPQADRDLGPQL